MANLIPEINPDEIENSTERLFAKLLVEHLPSRVKSGWSQMTHFAFKSMQEASDVCSRWLSAAAPSGFGCEKKIRLAPRPGCKNCWSCRRPVVSSLALLNHRLQALTPPAPFSIKTCRL